MSESFDTVAQAVGVNRAELLYAIRHDCVSFLAFYLEDELTLAVPEFHIDIWNEVLILIEQANIPAVRRSLRKLFAVPREHSKTTLAKLACILILKYSPLGFCLYVSKTNAVAKNAIRDILIWLNSAQERELYGPMKTIKSSETESLWIVDIAIRDDASSAVRYKRVIFKALGADQQVRGLLILNQRPNLIVIDDIEDNDNTSSPENQAGLDEWFMGALRKAFARNHLVIFLGNMIRKTTLLARLAKEPLWNPTVYGAIVRDKLTGLLRPLWEGRWTLDELLEEYAEYRRLGQGHTWEAEMMNLTQDEILQQDLSGVLRPPHPMPDDLTAGIIILDPAFGQNNWNDDSGITVHARVQGWDIPIIIDSRHGKYTEDELFDQLVELSLYWGITTWGIEADAAQRLFISYFTLLLDSRLMNKDAFLMLPLFTNRKAKASRILAMKRSMQSGSYGVDETQQDVVDKIRAYEPGSTTRDDLVDSAAHGLTCWSIHNEEITVRGIIQLGLVLWNRNGEGPALQSGVEVSF